MCAFHPDSDRANKKDIRDMPEEVRNEMEFLFADCIEDVLNALIPQLSERPLDHAA